MGLLVIGAGVGPPVGEDAGSANRGRNVGAVAGSKTIDGVVIGLRGVRAVVVVTDEVDPALDVRGVGAVQAGLGVVAVDCSLNDSPVPGPPKVAWV